MTMAPVVEKTFPRGGKKAKRLSAVKSGPSLFNKKKIKKNKRKSVTDEESDKSVKVPQLKARVIHDLTSKDFQPDFLVLGCISEVSQRNVQISLPGNLRALVNATKISDKFTEMIEKMDENIPELTDLFTVGDFFPIKILSGQAPMYEGSLNPKDVNAKLLKQDIKKGMVLSGAVVSREDHGYVIDLGLGKVTAFLPEEKVDDNVTYIAGQIVPFVVAKVLPELIQLSTKKAAFETCATSPKKPIHSFVPGNRFDAVVSEHLSSGISLRLGDSDSALKAYIHVNHLSKIFDEPSNYALESPLKVTLLYILPMVNYLFFKIEDQEKPVNNLEYGAIVPGKVVRVMQQGILLTVGDKKSKSKCFVSIFQMDDFEEILSGNKKIMNEYHVGDKIEKIRIFKMALFNRTYIASIKSTVISEPHFSRDDIVAGEILKCKIETIGPRFCTVTFGHKLKGFIATYDLGGQRGDGFTTRHKIGDFVKAKVLDVNKEERSIRLTTNPIHVKSKKRILKSYSSAKFGDAYLGTITKVSNKRLIVTFYGNVFGAVEQQYFPPGDYFIGQVVKCYVLQCHYKHLFLSIINPKKLKLFEVGTKYKVTIDEVADNGLYLIDKDNVNRGFLPVELLSQSKTLSYMMLKGCSKGDEISAYCIRSNPSKDPPIIFAKHPVISHFYKFQEMNDDLLSPGSTVPFCNVPFKSHRAEFIPVCPYPRESVFKGALPDLPPYSVIRVLIKKVNPPLIQVSSVADYKWNFDFEASLKDLDQFLEKIDQFHETKIKNSESKLKKYTIGKVVKACVEQFDESKQTTVLKIGKSNLGRTWKKLKPSTSIEGRVVWIDYRENIVWVQPYPNNGPVEIKEEQREIVRARIVYICSDVIVAECCGTYQLVFIPTRKNAYDLNTCESAYKLGEITKLKVFRYGTKLLGIDRRIALKLEFKAGRKEALRKKECANGGDSEEIDGVAIEYVREGTGMQIDSAVKSEIMSDDEIPINVSKDEDDDADTDAEIKVENDLEVSDNFDVLSSSSSSSDAANDGGNTSEILKVGFDWDLATKPAVSRISAPVDDTSSSEDEVEDKAEKKKRRRLTGSERKEKAKDAERRLCETENQLMDPTRPPQSADDYDRLVVANPNDSGLWLRYMAYHLENTEIEKGRAVAKRALKSISFREEQEKLNIWLALLNLENLYGTAETQKDAFEEALKYNDSYKIYLHKLNMLAENSEVIETEKLANFLVKKYSDIDGIWWEVGGALMKLGRLDAARSILQRGMASLPKMKHVALVTRFAQLENKYGSNERSQTLYEHVLSAFPKRIDVWSAYVDLMVKAGEIDLARSILERATSQSLPPRKMKTLYVKFLAFEEVHGTPDGVQRVRQAASEYTESVANNIN